MPGSGIRVLERFAVIRLKIFYASARVKRREIKNEKAKREARRIPRPGIISILWIPASAFALILKAPTATADSMILHMMTSAAGQGMPEPRTKKDRPRPEASALPRTLRPRSQGAPALLCFWINVTEYLLSEYGEPPKPNYCILGVCVLYLSLLI